MKDDNNNLVEKILYSQRIAQLSKALWKAVEKDWQTMIKPYDLNINEHHILWISFHLPHASISDISKFGLMHVSTAFNFSKKLEERGFIIFSKRDDDKRNTYIDLTEKGEQLIIEITKHHLDNSNKVVEASLPLKELYGKFPDLADVTAIVRNLYKDDFSAIFEHSKSNIITFFAEANDSLSHNVNNQK